MCLHVNLHTYHQLHLYPQNRDSDRWFWRAPEKKDSAIFRYFTEGKQKQVLNKQWKSQSRVPRAWVKQVCHSNRGVDNFCQFQRETAAENFGNLQIRLGTFWIFTQGMAVRKSSTEHSIWIKQLKHFLSTKISFWFISLNTSISRTIVCVTLFAVEYY